MRPAGAALTFGIVLVTASVAHAQQQQRAVAIAPVPGAQAFILLQSTRPEVVLERRVGSVGILGEDGGPDSGAASVWEQVCRAPCNLAVPRGDDFRVAGAGVRPSDPFRLPDADVVAVRARPGSPAQLAAGRALTSTGIGLALAGTALVLVPRPDDPTSSGTFDTLHTAGTVSLVAGGLLALVGIPLWLASATDVEASPAPAPQAPRTFLLAPGVRAF